MRAMFFGMAASAFGLASAAALAGPAACGPAGTPLHFDISFKGTGAASVVILREPDGAVMAKFDNVAAAFGMGGMSGMPPIPAPPGMGGMSGMWGMWGMSGMGGTPGMSGMGFGTSTAMWQAPAAPRPTCYRVVGYVGEAPAEKREAVWRIADDTAVFSGLDDTPEATRVIVSAGAFHPGFEPR